MDRAETDRVRVVRWVLGTPVVIVAWVACFLAELALIVTLLGIVIVAILHDDGGHGLFAPAVRLSEVVYR